MRLVGSGDPGRDELVDEARNLLALLGEGTMLTTAYDTAWVARLPNPTSPDQPLYPAAYEWLLRNQRNDGSWGSEVPKGHDRVISTLAALITLTECPWRRAESEPAARRAIVYLNGTKFDLQNDPAETVGFELILPELARQAQQLRLSLPYRDWAFVEAIQADKLRRIPPLALYGGPNPLTHSLEFLGDRVFPSLVQRSQSTNGSYGCSPSATAYVHLRAPNADTQRYLDRAATVDGLNGFTYLHPFEGFETAWVVDALEPLIKDRDEMEQATRQLELAWSPLGMAWSAECEFPDGDDTAMTLRLLTRQGRQKDPTVLQLFETPDYFQTFIYERNPSTTTNAHILAALREFPSTPDIRRMILKTLHYLEVARTDGTHWHDKWHASPLYATDCVITALAGLSTSLLEPAVEWMLSQQNENGSWGYDEGTQEETALAMRSLDVVGRNEPAWQKIALAALNRAGSWLVERHSQQDYPALWIGKGLYLPPLIVQATVLGALGRWIDSQPLLATGEF